MNELILLIIITILLTPILIIMVRLQDEEKQGLTERLVGWITLGLIVSFGILIGKIL